MDQLYPISPQTGTGAKLPYSTAPSPGAYNGESCQPGLQDLSEIPIVTNHRAQHKMTTYSTPLENNKLDTY